MGSRASAFPLEPRRQSVPRGDVVLALLPPFLGELWLCSGLVRIAHVLNGNGITPRVPRTVGDRATISEELETAALRTLALDIPLGERRATMRALATRHASLFDEILEHLLAGPETLFAFSVWRHNVDLTLEVCRQLRERRPEARIVLGGPEAIERGRELRGPWADCIVSGSGEDVIVPLARGFLDGQPGRARQLAHTWVAPEHPEDAGVVAPHRRVAELGPVNFEPLFPLVMDDSEPRLPVVLNVGCVFNCGFCTNRSVYPDVEWGQIETCVEEVSQLGKLWVRAWPDPQRRPTFLVEFCDATLNQYPKQFDELNHALALLPRPWSERDGGFRQGANWIVDRRVNEAVTEATAAAGFTNFFFGLESGSDRVRRAMQKPGKAAQVWDALVKASTASAGRIHVCLGVIAGWPDETEAEHLETLTFLERTASLEGLSPRVNVTPFIRTPNAQNQGLLRDRDGDAYGIRWCSEDPAGDPALRARRTMSYLECLGGIMPVGFPVPIDKLARWMLPAETHDVLDRWLEAQTRSHQLGRDEARRTASVGRDREASDHLDRGEVGRSAVGIEGAEAFDPAFIAALFLPGVGHDDQFRVVAGRESAEVSILLPSGDSFLTFILYPRQRDDARACYLRTRTFDICLRGREHTEEQLALADRVLAYVTRRDAVVASANATGSRS